MSTQDLKRKLTAILIADVKGYSRLMGANEEATVRDITACREVFFNFAKKHRGRIVDSPGDNVMAEFTSVVDAVRGAVDQYLRMFPDAKISELRRLPFKNSDDACRFKEGLRNAGLPG